MDKIDLCQLAKMYSCCIKTIQRRIDAFTIEKSTPIPRNGIVLMDSTYWGRNFGVMLFKNAFK